MRITVSGKPTRSTRLTFTTKEATAAIPDFSGERDEIAVRYEGAATVITVGLGDKKECTPAVLRGAAANGIRKALDLKRTAVSLMLPAITLAGEDGRVAAVEGAILAPTAS